MTRRVRGALLAALLACAGCGRSSEPAANKAEPTEAQARGAAEVPSAEVAPHPRLAARAPRALNAPRLPEDPVLAARTSAATDERRAKKRHKRFVLFDRESMPVHRELLKVIATARVRYDRARTESALSAARAAVSAELEQLDRGIAKLDAKSVGSRLLDDYQALRTELAAGYPDAKLASLRGDSGALTAAQASFDRRLQAMHAWLEEAQTAKVD